jgi:hypothetical protein
MDIAPAGCFIVAFSPLEQIIVLSRFIDCVVGDGLTWEWFD